MGGPLVDCHTLLTSLDNFDICIWRLYGVEGISYHYILACVTDKYLKVKNKSREIVRFYPLPALPCYEEDYLSHLPFLYWLLKMLRLLFSQLNSLTNSQKHFLTSYGFLHRKQEIYQNKL